MQRTPNGLPIANTTSISRSRIASMQSLSLLFILLLTIRHLQLRQFSLIVQPQGPIIDHIYRLLTIRHLQLRQFSLIVQPQGPIIDHLQDSDYRYVYDLGIEPIELKKVHGSFVSAN
uniref:Uncharacterized protein n=1 Tax=Meloidogyne enterolobii TaxID=390850 RepID=A0A6V7W7B0_MELEN|nr:unnamed protein product [Meloidogyne enterolobii]